MSSPSYCPFSLSSFVSLYRSSSIYSSSLSSGEDFRSSTTSLSASFSPDKQFVMIDHSVYTSFDREGYSESRFFIVIKVMNAMKLLTKEEEKEVKKSPSEIIQESDWIRYSDFRHYISVNEWGRGRDYPSGHLEVVWESGSEATLQGLAIQTQQKTLIKQDCYKLFQNPQ
jgi:hypothetical protein